MWYYVTKRILATLPVMGVVAVIVFLLLRLSPGDPAAIIAGDDATSEDIAKIREHLGLDRPLLTQFVRWIGHLATGDFGNSIYLERPVLGLIMERVEPTLALSVSTIIFAVVLAVPIGVLAAWRAGTWIDQAIMALSVLAAADEWPEPGQAACLAHFLELGLDVSDCKLPWQETAIEKHPGLRHDTNPIKGSKKLGNIWENW